MVQNFIFMNHNPERLFVIKVLFEVVFLLLFDFLFLLFLGINDVFNLIFGAIVSEFVHQRKKTFARRRGNFSNLLNSNQLCPILINAHSFREFRDRTLNIRLHLLPLNPDDHFTLSISLRISQFLSLSLRDPLQPLLFKLLPLFLFSNTLCQLLLFMQLLRLLVFNFLF